LAPKPAPAFFAGTSSEFLGRRALPRVVRERRVAVIMGPSAVGKSVVAKTIARLDGGRELRLDAKAAHKAVVAFAETTEWPDRLLEPSGIILDPIGWIRERQGFAKMLAKLIVRRASEGRRTILVQGDDHVDAQAILAHLPPGMAVSIALRFPQSHSGRMRFARRICDELGIPRLAARGTASIQPWGYRAVVDSLKTWDPAQLD